MSFLTRIFPKKVKTLHEFILCVEKEKIPSISITPLVDGNFNAILVHEARSNAGQRIVYRDIIRRLNPVLMPQAMHREKMRLCLVGEQRIKALQKKFPHIKAHLIFEGKIVESFEELHREAKANRIL